MKSPDRLVGALILLVVLVGARAARGDGVDTGLFRPPATSGGVLGVGSAFTAPHLSVAAALYFDYANGGLIEQTSAGQRVSTVVGDALGLQAAVSLSLWRRLEVGVAMPAVLYQRGDGLPGAGGLPSAAAGDLRIEAKVFLGRLAVGTRDRWIGFGLGAGIGTPTGNAAALNANDGVSFWPRLLVTGWLRPVDVFLDIGAVIRGSRQVGGVTVGQQLRVGLGARAALVRGFGVEGTLQGLVALSGTTGQTGSPFEFLIGPDYRFTRLPFELSIAAGRGLTNGIGAPNARVVLALRYQPRQPSDRDRDGLIDRHDVCPEEAGPRENHGCPDADRDGDDIVDRLDRCPVQAGPASNQGCPIPDTDGDGVLDPDDRCPRLPGPRENRGCPDHDGDGDGVVDRLDRCPAQAGPVSNRGCPIPDTDGDGILDPDDRCPREPENFNGFEDDDGCPDRGSALARLTEREIVITQQVFFETGKAKVKAVSFPLLAAVAKIMALHPELERIRVEGHTDNRGGRAYNVRLSQARADAVRDHLVQAFGVATDRLEARGFGPDQPIADNATTAGRARNRRSAFVIVRRKGAPAAEPAP